MAIVQKSSKNYKMCKTLLNLEDISFLTVSCKSFAKIFKICVFRSRMQWRLLRLSAMMSGTKEVSLPKVRKAILSIDHNHLFESSYNLFEISRINTKVHFCDIFTKAHPGFPPIQKQVNHTLPSYSQYDSRLIILWTIKVMVPG